MGAHVWIKAHTITLETCLKDIDSKDRDLDGKNIMEAVLAVTTTMNGKEVRPFLHMEKMWTRNKNEQKWGVVVHKKLEKVAGRINEALKDKLLTKYGDEKMRRYFKDPKRGFIASYQANLEIDDADEDNWFTEDEGTVDELVGGCEKLILIEGMDQFIMKSGGLELKHAEIIEEETTSLPTVLNDGSTMGLISATTTIKDANEEGSQGSDVSATTVNWLPHVADNAHKATIKKRLRKIQTEMIQLGINKQVVLKVIKAEFEETNELITSIVSLRVGFPGAETVAMMLQTVINNHEKGNLGKSPLKEN